MSKVYALPYNVFNDMMTERNITDENVEEWKNQAFIEVQGKEDIKDEKLAFHFKQDHPNVLRLTFDDVEEDTELPDLSGDFTWAYCINEEQAKILHEFIHRNKDKHFLTHCYAGVSRSGAISQYICEIKDIPLTTFQEMNPYSLPSRRVLSELRKLDV